MSIIYQRQLQYVYTQIITKHVIDFISVYLVKFHIPKCTCIIDTFLQICQFGYNKLYVY